MSSFKSSIKDKVQMYDLLIRGRLGNTLALWNNVDEMEAEGYVGRYAIRSKLPRGEFLPNLYCSGDYQAVDVALEDYLYRNRAQSSMIIFAAMDGGGGRRVLTGEIMRYPMPLGQCAQQLVLHYSHIDALYREAMSVVNDKSTIYGMRAMATLQKYLDPGDYDSLMEILETYEDAIVEFTVFEKRLGIFNRRMVVWEVRSKY